MNVCTFYGRLGQNAKTNYTGSGKVVSNFDIAVTEVYNNEKITEWVPCVLWKHEGALQYLTKGRQVVVSGQFKTRKWTDKNGQERYKSEIIVHKLDLIFESQQQHNQGYQQSQQQQQQEHFINNTNSMDEVPF